MTGSFIRCKPTEQFISSWNLYDKNMGKLIHSIRNGKTLREIFRVLKKFPLIGNFMAWQVLSDIKLCGLVLAKTDNGSFVVFGPGAKRGIALLEKQYSAPLALLCAIKKDVDELNWMNVEDVEHCLCEFYKYYRASKGGQMPKQRYKA
jgi:hypothetical protein